MCTCLHVCSWGYKLDVPNHSPSIYYILRQHFSCESQSSTIQLDYLTSQLTSGTSVSESHKHWDYRATSPAHNVQLPFLFPGICRSQGKQRKELGWLGLGLKPSVLESWLQCLLIMQLLWSLVSSSVKQEQWISPGLILKLKWGMSKFYL